MKAFYHYTSAANLSEIFSGEAYGRKGLLPIRRFFPLGVASNCGLPEKASEGVISGLTEPLPAAWTGTTGKRGDSILENMLSNIGDDIALLRATVKPDDDVHVADWGVNLTPYKGGTQAMRRLRRAYFNSLTPFFNDNGGQTAPEVVCFTPIPLNRVQVVEMLPRWQLVNRIRKNTGRTLVMPRREPSLRDLEELLGLDPKPEPEGPGATVYDIRPRP